MFLQSLVLTAEVFDHVLQLDLTDLRLVEQQPKLLLQLRQRPRQLVSFLRHQTRNAF